MTLQHQVYGAHAPDILLIHGWASSKRMWGSIIQNFGHLGRFWALDLAGFGQSPPITTPLNIADHVQSVIAFCDNHRLQPQMIIAHSMGGLITLKLLRKRPDLAQQVVLIAPVVTGEFGFGLASAFLRTETGAALVQQSRAVWNIFLQEAFLRMIPLHENATISAMIQADLAEAQPRAAIEALISMPYENMQPYLAAIQQSTLVAVGKYDVTVPPSEGRIAALYMPNAHLELFAQSRHRPHDEQPHDFMPILREFFQRHGLAL